MNSNDENFTVLTKPDGLADENSSAWNIQLTRLLRNTERYAWGNWNLDPTIKVGALGWFNPTDSHFQPAQYAIKVNSATDKAAVDWHLEQGEVKQSSVGVEFKVPYKDPTTGIDVTAGLQTKWEFGSKGSLTSQGSAYGIEYVVDPAKTMLDNYEQALKVATANNKANDGVIDQGFGMITKVWLTDGCVNIGSRQDKSDFSITGSVDGIAALTGSDQSASLKGSYKNTSESNNVEKRIFPSKSNEVDNTPVAYAYEFTSYNGKIIIPRWVADISYLSLEFRNTGSYIFTAYITYDTPQSKRNQKQITLSGWLTGQINGIPLDATNLEIRMEFVAGATQYLRVSNPINTWFMGRGLIEVTAWWPKATDANWK